MLGEPRDQNRAAASLRNAVRLGVQGRDFGDLILHPCFALAGQARRQGVLVDPPEGLDLRHLLQDDHIERSLVPLRAAEGLDRVPDGFQDQSGSAIIAQLLQPLVDFLVGDTLHQRVKDLLDLVQGLTPQAVARHRVRLTGGPPASTFSSLGSS